MVNEFEPSLTSDYSTLLITSVSRLWFAEENFVDVSNSQLPFSLAVLKLAGFVFALYYVRYVEIFYAIWTKMLLPPYF